jgi:hypothetical protein
MADQLATILAALTGMADDAVKDVALEVTSAAIDLAPVDTGNLRAHIVPSIGPPALSSSTPERVDHSAQQAGIVAIASGYHLDLGEVTIVFGAEYTEEVDKRQPFVKAAIDSGVAAAVAKGRVGR